MMANLKFHVSVHSPEHGTVTFGPGDAVPEWAVGLITNPNAWVESSIDDSEEAPGGDDDESDDEVGIPPVKGPGSSAKAWAAYALTKGFEVETDAKASEIRDALAEAGIPVE